MRDTLDSRIAAARKEIAELEQSMEPAGRQMLEAQLSEIRRIRREKAD